MAMLGGLLGETWDDPRTMGLLGLAANLMQARKPLQGLTQGLMTYGGALAEGRRAKEEAEARAQRKRMQELQVEQLTRQMQRQRDMEALPSQFAGGPQFDMAGYSNAMYRYDPQVAMALQASMRKDTTPIKVGKGDTLLDPQTLKPIMTAPDTQDLPGAVREYQFAVGQGYKGSFEQWQLNQKRAGASNTSVSYGTPVAAVDAAGNPVFIQPSKHGGAPAIIPGMRPPKSAAEEKAEAERLARDRQSQQMVTALTEAEGILKGGKATASGVGNLMDAGARMVGVSTPGAQDAARLEALSGWLVANVPRMEGPQSNFDVQNYMTMAGKVGDRTTPISERLAALNEVRRLQKKYADINGAVGGRQSVNVDDLLKKYGGN